MRVVPLLAGCIVAPAHLGHRNYLMRYVCLVICVLIRPDHHERRLNVLMGSGEDTTNVLFQYIFLGTAFIRFSVPKLRSHASYKRYTTTHNAMQCTTMSGRLWEGGRVEVQAVHDTANIRTWGMSFHLRPHPVAGCGHPKGTWRGLVGCQGKKSSPALAPMKTN